MKTPKKIPFWTLLLAGVILAFTIAMAIIMMRQNDGENIIAGWGDSSGGRSSYTKESIEKGILKNTVIFNTISDGQIGDEKNFVGARIDSGTNNAKTNQWHGNAIEAEDGAIYYVRIYLSNNSPLGYNGISENTKVAFNVPTESAKRLAIHGFIFSDNASPNEYWDGVLFQSDSKFHFEYIYGSALLENGGIGANGGCRLSDEIVTKAASNNGTLVGYDSLDGKIPGGDDYISYISIRVKVVFDTNLRIE